MGPKRLLLHFRHWPKLSETNRQPTADNNQFIAELNNMNGNPMYAVAMAKLWSILQK